MKENEWGIYKRLGRKSTYGREDLATTKVVIVAHYDAIDGLGAGGVVYKVATTEVGGDLTY